MINLINNLRLTSVKMIESAKSGHPGITLSTAPLFCTLYANHLNVIPSKPIHLLRDRFVVCSGHASAILYATLNAFGFDVTKNDLKNFRKTNSKTCGLPNVLKTPGVDCTTGALGEGVSTAVGMALAERILAQKFNKRDCELFDNYTYVLVGEGSLMEGVSYESLSLAGSLKLHKLIVFYDCNNITIEGDTKNVFEQDTIKVMEALGFNVFEVLDANNIDEINSAIKNAKNSQNKPNFIVVHSTIGWGSHMQGIPKVHGTPLGEKGINYLKENLNYKGKEFEFNETELTVINRAKARFKNVEKEFNERWDFYKHHYKKEYLKLKDFLNNKTNLSKELADFTLNKDMSLRDSGGLILNEIAKFCENIVGGSADVAPSTKTELHGYDFITSESYDGRNIRFGVREFGMACITNGLALYGALKPFCSTFLAFSDYMKAGIRHSAIMNTHSVFIFTHDSIAVGEDGITHQPVEQLWNLRNIPNVNLFRPCDFNECKACFAMAFDFNKPSIITLCRQKVKNLNSDYKKTFKGAYVIKPEIKKHIDCILIATGSEVQLALNCASELENKGYSIRVVSMPSTNVFDEQSENYKNLILPKDVKTKVSIELGCDSGWYKYVGDKGKAISINSFGISGDFNDLLNIFGFTKENICKQVIKLIKQNN